MRHRATHAARQGLEHPYIHAVALATAWSALMLYLSLDADPMGIGTGTGITLAVSAIVAASLIVTGLQWIDRVVGAGIEFAGQLLIVVVWFGDIVILWNVLHRPWTSTVVPFLFAAAGVARAFILWRRVRKLKSVVDDLPERSQGVAWDPQN